ncbi:transposase [Streptomyces phaeogriseichromatogenes]|nr:transposase [Streptomyces murinus]
MGHFGVCWTIERIMAWLAGCRRLHRRYERKADHFLAFTSNHSH